VRESYQGGKYRVLLALNEILVKLDKRATNAALSIPADRLSAEMTIYNQVMLCPFEASTMNSRFVTVDIKPSRNNILTTPKRIDNGH
jgi:hypothetical protein